MSFTYVKKRKLKGVPCFRPLLRDPKIGDGELRLLLLLKAKAQDGMVCANQDALAVELSVTRATINRRIQGLEHLRLIKVKPNSRRGLKVESFYFIEDEFYAKHLARKPLSRCNKNATRVPYGTTSIPSDHLAETPGNIIPLPIPQETVVYLPMRKSKQK